MLFNSLEFFIFLFIVYIGYWFIFPKNRNKQNVLLLIGSYVFYGWWDWRFVLLLVLSTIIDYSFGLIIHRNNQDKKRKFFLWLSIFNNLFILCLFKYYNFFAESFTSLMTNFGLGVHPYLISIALPVGISFYTFHGMSYVFDIYNKKTTPTTNFVDYSLFVSFFPLLVAGPIERATHLLPQIRKSRLFTYNQSVAGLRLILWGLFKKIVIADSIAPLVDRIFEGSQLMSGLTLILGAILFAFQIYGDFSGYSDIARGVAKLFGFELLINFKFPYFSRDIAEFWRRWHISLSSWFRDYLYIPLGGSKEGTTKAVRNTFIIFLVSGFWHGANWTFIVWGFLHALYFLPLLLLKQNRKNIGQISESRVFPTLSELFKITITFCIVCLAWIFFRANTVSDALLYVQQIFSSNFIIGSEVQIFKTYLYLPIVLGILLIVEWTSRNEEDVVGFFSFKSKWLRYAVYYLVLLMIILYGSFEETAFIYFQF